MSTAIGMQVGSEGMRMRTWWFRGLILAAICCASLANAQTVTPCPDTNNCAQLTIGSATASGGSASIPVTFKQGPSNGQAGGMDEIAALAFTLSIGPNLALGGNCALNSDGLPVAVHPNGAISNFRVVVENASCAGGRTHCLCPDAGGTPDAFINFVVYGPNPLPTPGPNPVDIPILPAGPQELFTIDLVTTPGASGMIPLHVYSETTDSSKPQFTAYLSVGDRLAVDQTCVPVAGQPPCAAAGAVSQVAINSGTLDVGASCVGDCGNDGEVTVDELLRMVNISLGAASVDQCLAGDGNHDGEVTIDEIIQAVNKALNGCSV